MKCIILFLPSLLKLLHRKYHNTASYINCIYPPLFYSNHAISEVKSETLVFEVYSETTIKVDAESKFARRGVQNVEREVGTETK